MTCQIVEPSPLYSYDDDTYLCLSDQIELPAIFG